MVAATRCTPHIQDQKATGRSKGITVTGCLTTEVRVIKPTTDQLYQGTTGSPTGVVLQSWALFFIFCLSHLLVLPAWSLVPHSFPYMLLRPPLCHLTSHLMSHLTTSHPFYHMPLCHSPQPLLFTLYGSASLLSPIVHLLWTASSLPAYDGTILRLPAHCQLMIWPYYTWLYCSVTSTVCDILLVYKCRILLMVRP